jgi:hypothetical protein
VQFWDQQSHPSSLVAQALYDVGTGVGTMASTIAKNDYRRSPPDAVRMPFLESTQGSPPIAPPAGETDSGSADEGKRVNVVGAVRQRIGELDYVVDEYERVKTGNDVVNCANQTNCESRELGNRSGHVADQPEVRPLRSPPPPYWVIGNATG